MADGNSKTLIDTMSARYAGQDLPPMVILDLTNTCNLKCIHCPQPFLQAQPGFKPNHMEWDHFQKIVDEIAGYSTPILLRIAGDGEPTIHPQIVEMVEYIKKNSHATVNLTTNGLVMKEAMAKRLLEAGIDIIDFSIDAYSKDVFETVRRGGKLEKLLGNIFGLLDQRNLRRFKTKVMVSFVEQAENRHEVDLFRNFWDPFVDQVLIRQLHSAVGQVKVEEAKAGNQAESRERFPCPHLWKRLTVDYRGAVKYCAHDWALEESVSLGHISQDSLAEIWKGERLAGLRRNHMSNDFPKGETCTTCTDWASTRWDFGYERLIDRVVHEKALLAPDLPL